MFLVMVESGGRSFDLIRGVPGNSAFRSKNDVMHTKAAKNDVTFCNERVGVEIENLKFE